MIKILLGGSPCTHWSIAQSKHRETKAEGLGWELFLNYVIAKEKFKPDFFLYENNWSASKEIKEQIQRELDCKLMRINSRLVSAQKRDRFYVFNWEVEQPEDRGILLKDILETGGAWQEKSYELTTKCGGAIPSDTIKKHRHAMIAEPIRVGSYPTKNGELKGGQGQRIYDINGKSVSLTANGGGMGAKTGLYAVPMKVKEATKAGFAEIMPGECADLEMENSKTIRGRKMNEKSNCLTTTHAMYEYCGTIDKPIYKVVDGKIDIKGNLYPIKLKDGYYIIRKLTPVECERLQTLPDDYTKVVSNTQRYKGIGNGWTAEVIIHILQGALKDVPKDEKIVALSMYDGIGTGRYCLDKMGFTNVEYHAYEIDKYAMKVAMSNYPDIIQHGDAFDLRKPDWSL